MNLCLMFGESKDDGCGEQVFLMTETSSLTATHCWSLACPAMTSACKYFHFATQMTDVSIINFKICSAHKECQFCISKKNIQKAIAAEVISNACLTMTIARDKLLSIICRSARDR
ncbi:hypothetical protein T10_6049 [Trichinella papuae]|uniref:Uncharacterized protein n=1 Tax=Trichinella papuae TaxID=268474 RepID=A0A0V1MCS1_9BILA|nr:hypothetical protein T10_6049 [Trichinella papuae]